jgi:hypothetical protein
VNEWLEVGAIDRAIFGGGQFSKYELHRAALVFELVKFINEAAHPVIGRLVEQ